LSASRSDQANVPKNNAESIATGKEFGGRRPKGVGGTVLYLVALSWTVFQIYVISPLPFVLGSGFIIDDTQIRLIFYAFTILLTFCLFPAFKKSSRSRVPFYDWALALTGAATSLYIFFFYDTLAARSGAPLTQDIVVASLGLLILFEATRRAVGIPLAVVVITCIAYAFLGPYMPDVIAHRFTSMGRVADHMWLSTQGVFGIPLGIATNFVFLFVMFGALLEKAGAGIWFMRSSFALLGHLKGGPAKASVVASAFFGMISGSALANVVTTGTFTIPLMIRTGFPAEKAAAIESSSSINGQVMPPVMGAVAFMIMEFVGVSYLEVITHAFLPAFISYIGLYYIVHLESIKLGLRALPRRGTTKALQKILRFAAAFLGAFIIVGGVYYILTFVKAVWADSSFFVVFLLFVLAYLALLLVSSRVPELVRADPNEPMDVLPETIPTLLAGLHYLLPVGVLIWCLIVERFSPGLSIYWASLVILFILLTQRPIIAFFRGRGGYIQASLQGTVDVVDGMVTGARNMVGIGATMAAAGIIVGAVSLTGIGLVLVSVIDTLSGGYLFPMLLITAVITIILGMGLSSSANYLVVSALMAPVVTSLAAQGGLVIPLIAVHFFVFYCALVSGNTPPVALDAYVAAGIAKADPLKTCLQAFYYTMRTMILPFIFIFNTELLMIGIKSWWHAIFVITASLAAMLLFVAACQGYLLVRSRRYESALLLVVAFTLVRPAFWLDQIYPPFEQVDPTMIEQYAEEQPSGTLLRMWVEGQSFNGRLVRKVVVLPLGQNGPSGAERFEKAAGLTLQFEAGKVLVDNVRFNSPANQEAIDVDWEIQTLEVPVKRPNKVWLYIPALFLLGAVVFLQAKRRGRSANAVPNLGRQ